MHASHMRLVMPLADSPCNGEQPFLFILIGLKIKRLNNRKATGSGKMAALFMPKL
jgi:hypothetical protein